MRRLLGVLKSFWLVSVALWLAGVGLCLWWIPRLGGGPQRLAIAVALLSAVWMLAVVLRKYRRVRAERDLEALVQLEVNREAANAASRAGDYEVLRERLKAALGMLRARGKNNGGLSELPWFLVVGHSASGKTSLLTRSGLNASVAGIGAETGTQYCDWYFGSDAVLIDTAGRYIAEEQPAHEFADFLKLLARRRKRTPVNGLVVVVDLPALLSASREDNHALARQLIERIDEYRAAMDSAPPVYLCFSKVDLVPGFVEAFADLDAETRRRPWGMSFPVAEIRGKGLGRAFVQRFESLVASLRAHVEHRVVDAGRDADSALLRFPDYVAEIQGRLADFLEPFDLHHNPDTAPLTRGLYFTSALQRGEGLRPILDETVGNTFALSGSPTAERPAPRGGDERGYFIQGLFRDVLIADRNLVEHQSRNGRRRSLHLGLVAGGVLAGLGAIGLMANAFWTNRDGLIAFEQQLAAVSQADAVTKLETLRAELARLHHRARQGAALWQDAGLDAGDRLGPGLEHSYFAALQRQVLAPVAAGLGDQLAEVGTLAQSLGLETELPAAVSGHPGQADAAGIAADRGRELLAGSGERLRERLTQRPTLGSVPRSPGELAGRLRGEADYRLRGSVDEAYWSARSDGREALREGARDAWENARDGGLEAQLADSAAIGPSFSTAALNRLEPGQVADLIAAYDALKLYLILTDPEAHPDQDFVNEALPRAWLQAVERDDRVPRGERLIRDHVALYAAYLERGKAPALPRDERLVAQARADLRAFLVQASPADREYLRLRLAAERQFPALTLADILPKADLPLMYAGEVVPAFFTHRVWREFVQPELAKTLASGLNVERDWVLEGDSELDEVQGKAQFARAVLARYKRDYIYAWERFLADVGVRRFGGLAASRKRLTQLSDYQRSPLKVLLREVDANTRWDSPDAEQRQAGTDGQAAKPESAPPGLWRRTLDWIGGADPVAGKALVQRDMPTIHDGLLAHHFEPVRQLFDMASGDDATRMDRYLLLLRQLKARLDGLERGDVGKRTKQLVGDVIGGRANEITELHNYVAANIDTSRDELVQSVQRLFRAPVEYAEAGLDGPIASQLAAAWGEQVSTPWNRMVGGRYPVSDSGNEASVRDLRHFVDPNAGLLTRFDAQEVGNLAEASRRGEPLVDPRITGTIARGTAVGTVLDSLADVENGFEIMVEPAPNLTAITLTVDGQQSVYRNGPQSWQRFTWPGDERQAGARLEVVTLDGRRIEVFDFPSRWGLLRMLDAAVVTDLDDVRQRFSWLSSAGPVSIRVRNFGGVKLTDLDQVRRLHIPRVGAR